MKKIISFILLFLVFTLVGCSYNSKVKSEILLPEDKFKVIKDELKDIPEVYNLDEGVEEGHFVVIHGKLNSDINILNKFIEESSNGKSSEIIIVEYTIEGDPIITKIKYDGESYYGVVDNTRDDFGKKYYFNFEFLYLKSFEKDNTVRYYFVNDDTLTYDEIEGYLSEENGYDIMQILILNRI